MVTPDRVVHKDHKGHREHKEHPELVGTPDHREQQVEAE